MSGDSFTFCGLQGAMKGGPHAVRPAEAADSLRTSDTREKKSSYPPQSLLVNIPVHARGPASMYVHFCDLRWRLCMRAQWTPQPAACHGPRQGSSWQREWTSGIVVAPLTRRPRRQQYTYASHLEMDRTAPVMRTGHEDGRRDGACPAAGDRRGVPV